MTPIRLRRKTILEIIQKNGYMRVADLAEKLGVTTVTIRTDLTALEEEGQVTRSHGGVIPSRTNVIDLHEDTKSLANVALKKRIASVAASLVEENDSIIIASGSTMAYFAEKLDPEENLNVVTPSIRIAYRLVENPNITVMQLGGIVYGNTLSTHGEYAEAGLGLFQCTKLFFGVEGFDLNAGLTCATLQEANLTRKMMKAATQTIVLADSTKFCRRGFGLIAHLDAIDVLITDDGLPAEAKEQIEHIGVKVIIA